MHDFDKKLPIVEPLFGIVCWVTLNELRLSTPDCLRDEAPEYQSESEFTLYDRADIKERVEEQLFTPGSYGENCSKLIGFSYATHADDISEVLMRAVEMCDIYIPESCALLSVMGFVELDSTTVRLTHKGFEFVQKWWIEDPALAPTIILGECLTRNEEALKALPDEIRLGN